jgi:hypothetical protein
MRNMSPKQKKTTVADTATAIQIVRRNTSDASAATRKPGVRLLKSKAFYLFLPADAQPVAPACTITRLGLSRTGQAS